MDARELVSLTRSWTGPGELLIGLKASGRPEISILRQEQQDLSMAVEAKRTEPDIPDLMSNLMRNIAVTSTVRTFTFHDFAGLHAFESAITGWFVRFDA